MNVSAYTDGGFIGKEYDLKLDRLMKTEESDLLGDLVIPI